MANPALTPLFSRQLGDEPQSDGTDVPFSRPSSASATRFGP